MKNLRITLTLLVVMLNLASCAHESIITPSNGHIDAQINNSQANKAAAALPADIPSPIKNKAFLPPPTPKAKEQTYSVVVNDVPVKEILFALARESKLNIDIHPDIKGNVTMNAVDQTLPAILERLSKQVDLTYKIENNVLNIRPDTPVLRMYQINYVNMDRDTTGAVSVSNQIASSSSGNISGTSTAPVSGTSTTGLNTSSTSVKSKSENHFWESLVGNITQILLESDKEVLVKRYQSDANLQNYYSGHSQANSRGDGSVSAPYPSESSGTSGNARGKASARGAGNVSGSGNEALQADGNASSAKISEDNQKEYKTLYAAAVIPNKETGVLSVRATQRQQEKVQEFIDKVQANARRQVLIEASIVEIELNDQYQAGVDWSRMGTGGALSGFTFQQDLLGASLTTAPRIAIGYNKTGTALGDLAASVRLLQTFGTTKVLSSPKLMVLNSQTAILKAVDNLVYFTVQSTPAVLGTSGSIISPATFTTTPQTVPVGIWMSVTPQINENGTVTLNVRPTISRKLKDIQDPNPNLTLIPSLIPQIRVREMESMLQVPSGNTVILGGLMQDDISKTTNGVPGAADAPVIGNAFKARNNNIIKTELVIFLRPTVIPNASLESDELQTYKQYLPSQQMQRKADESAD